jgi:hypothetical protein
MFGYIMDHGAPNWVFHISVGFMIATAAAAWFGDRRMAARRRERAALAQPQAAE